MSDGPDNADLKGFTLYYLRLQEALDGAVDRYTATSADLIKQPPLAGIFVPIRTIDLMNALEEHRATALLLAAACVEGVANLYLRFKATPDQITILDRAS